MRKSTLLIIALFGLLAGLLFLGYWSWTKKVDADLADVFTSGVFSPIRARYPSFVTPEQEAEIRRLEDEMHRQLEAKARAWKIVSLSSCGASAVPLAALLLLAWRAWKKRQAAPH